MGHSVTRSAAVGLGMGVMARCPAGRGVLPTGGTPLYDFLGRCTVSLALKLKVAIVVMSMVDTVLVVAAANVWLNDPGYTHCTDCEVAPSLRPPTGVETFGDRPATKPSTSRVTSRPPAARPSRIPTPSSKPTPKPTPKETPSATPSSPPPPPTFKAAPTTTPPCTADICEDDS